jgi:uncharacterized protein (TIGR00645 family)
MLERNLERLLFASRWVLAPVYLGLALGMLALAIKFFQEIVHLLLHVLVLPEADVVLALLGLVDLVLVGSLIIMVMLSGYENFVSRIDLDEGAERLAWLGKLDAGSLKIKVAASIVAISSIHLQRAVMNAQQFSNDQLLFFVGIHLTVVVTALLHGDLHNIPRVTH